MAVTAPFVPARLGEPVDPQAMLRFLPLLEQWVAGRRRELDELDAAAQARDDSAHLTSDIMLSMTLWQAVKTRYDAIFAAWDSGRVGPTEREKLSALMWGRLDALATGSAAGISGMNVNLPEACRLSDALAASLRSKLQLAPDADGVSFRINALRAQMERLRDQVKLEPAGHARESASARVSALEARLATMAEKASRGGDIGGMIGPLEIDATIFERDLIVGGAQRHKLVAQRAAAVATRGQLEAREGQLQTLVQQAMATVTPTPKYAVPHVAALGDVPHDVQQVAEYVSRLDRVRQAMDVVEQAYTAVLTQHQDLAVQMQALTLKATGLGDADLSALADVAGRAIAKRPSDLVTATQLVQAYASAVAAVVEQRKQ